MIVFFNNCRGDDYSHYGSSAFYDLKTEGIQSTKVTDLTVGQQCIVASPGPFGQIIFNWYSFQCETVMLGKFGKHWRVFFGKFIRSDTLPKRDAARNDFYSPFFDKNCHFKRQSVIQR